MASAIKIEGLGKKYLLNRSSNASARHYATLREVLAEGAKKFLRPQELLKRTETEDFWALKDVNLKIEQGDKVAIIGHNGAGKSTLLKILSQITEPTEGRVELYGRVASLLEVGTGFHPELTGRENIYLNGSILGMSHAEVRRKFDEIVDFSGVKEFLDMPVKRYSSGMRMRLGFAVAAHLESEILIIDEVLAVGDAAFQKKCLGKMDEVSKSEGRTILFVSHNMGAVQQLCEKGILLNRGGVDSYGEIKSIVSRYGETVFGYSTDSVWVREASIMRADSAHMNFTAISLRDMDGHSIVRPIRNDRDVVVHIEMDIFEPGFEVGYILYDSNGQSIYCTSTFDLGDENRPRALDKSGKQTVSTIVPKRLLNEGRYSISPFAHWSGQGCFIHPTRLNQPPRITFEISGGLSDSPNFQSRREGIIAPLIRWKNN